MSTILWTLSCCLFAGILFSSCTKSADDVVLPPSEFSKLQREQLGNKVKFAIAIQDDRFPVLPNIPPFDTTVYFYIQTLYDQVTNEIKRDFRSPSDDQWDADREWNIIVVNQENKNLFSIPGGGIYLTTGLLRSLKSEHELYYLLAFETILMNDRFLLNKIISQFNTNVLSKIAKGSARSDEPSAKDIAQIIDQLYFDTEEVKNIDKLTSELVCKTSVMNRFGLLRLLTVADDSWTWLDYRATYDGRASLLQQLDLTTNCGDFITNGGYQRYVLDYL